MAGPRKIPKYTGHGILEQPDTTVLVLDDSVFHISSDNQVTVNKSSDSYEVGCTMFYMVANDA